MEFPTAEQAFMHPRQTKTLLANVLQRLVDAKRVTIAQLADATGVDYSTARRWVIGENGLPDVHELRAIARADTIPMEARLEILGVVTCDTPLRVAGRSDAEQSANVAEVAQHALNGTVQQAELARHAVSAQADGRIDAAEAMEGLEKCRRARASLDCVEASFERCAARGPRSVAG
jgi:transcriptional regulator with XRE-family HTH domain